MLLDALKIKDVVADIIHEYLGSSGLRIFGFLGDLIVSLLIIIIGMKVADYLVKLMKTALEKSNIEVTLQTFLISLVRIGLKIVVIIWAVTNLGVAESSIVAALGSGALALGLSLQGSLSNIAGGVILLLMKPFTVGDYIFEDATGKEGIVQAIGIMYTKLLTTDNKEILIPNGSLMNTSITNINRQGVRRVDIFIGVEYSADIRLAKDILTKVVSTDEAVLKDHEVTVFVDSFEDSAVKLGVRYWVPTDMYWVSRWRSNERIKEELESQGIYMPYNKLDVNLQSVSEDSSR